MSDEAYTGDDVKTLVLAMYSMSISLGTITVAWAQGQARRGLQALADAGRLRPLGSTVVDVDWTHNGTDPYADNTEDMIKAEDGDWTPPTDLERPERRLV